MTNPDRFELTGTSSDFSLYAGGMLLPGQYIVGVGVDRCDAPRIMADIQKHPYFILENFTPPEIAYCEQAKRASHKAQLYAARFAGKEAVIKALGGIEEPGLIFLDINILRKESGQPFVLLTAAAQRRAQAIGATEIFISLTHEKNTAMAFCVAVGIQQPPAHC